MLYDLTETLNQGANVNTRPFDEVENFTVREVQEALKNATDLDDYRANLEALGKDHPGDVSLFFNN